MDDIEKLEIVDQLNTIQSRGFNPRDCAALLSQLRVLIEREGVQTVYPHAWMYGNWSAHSKLSHGAKDVFEKCDQVIALVAKKSIPLDETNSLFMEV